MKSSCPPLKHCHFSHARPERAFPGETRPSRANRNADYQIGPFPDIFPRFNERSNVVTREKRMPHTETPFLRRIIEKLQKVAIFPRTALYRGGSVKVPPPIVPHFGLNSLKECVRKIRAAIS